MTPDSQKSVKHIDNSPELLSLMNKNIANECELRNIRWNTYIGKERNSSLLESLSIENEIITRQLVERPFEPLAVYYNIYFMTINQRFEEVYLKQWQYNNEKLLCREVTFNGNPVTRNTWFSWLISSNTSDGDRKKVFDAFIAQVPAFKEVVMGYFDLYWTILDEIDITLDNLYQITDGISVKELVEFLEKFLETLSPNLPELYAEMTTKLFEREPEYYDDPWSVYNIANKKLKENELDSGNYNLVVDFLKEMGYDLSRITVDTTQREKKQSGAFCFAIKVPDDVRVSLHSTQGYYGFTKTLHELGHAVYYSGIDPNLPAYLRQYGDREIVREVPSLLFGMYMPSVTSFREHFLGKTTRDFTAALIDVNQSFVLQYAIMAVLGLAKLKNYEKHSLNAITSECRQLIERYMKIPLPAEFWYIAPQAMYVQSYEVYIYCTAVAIEIAKNFEEDYGNDWWKNTEAHARLRELWSKGFSSTDHLPKPDPELLAKWLLQSMSQ
ncbi:MAG: hypothetical protein ACFFD4_40435 [Candidatus Odinarchaeota archaeon]